MNKKQETLHKHKRGLLAVAWPLVGVTLMQALLIMVSLELLSSVQAYMRLESNWSRGVNDATLFLHRYLDSLSEYDFNQYKAAIARPLGYREARLAMEAERDEDQIRVGLLAGGSTEDEIPRIVQLFSHFQHVDYLMNARRIWTATDSKLLALVALGNEMHRNTRRGPTEVWRVDKWRRELQAINQALNTDAVVATEQLATGTRSSIHLLIAVNLGAALVLISLGLFTTRRLLAQRSHVEVELKHEQALANITLASIGDGVLRTDAMGRINYMNAAAETLLGRKIGDVRLLPLSTAFQLADEHGERTADRILERTQSGESDVTVTCDLLRNDGSHVSVSVAASAVRDDTDDAFGSVLVLRDTTRERQYVAKLSWQASHDPLTGLVNRREFERRLTRAIERVNGQGGKHALLFLDLDQFKIVNDSCGHDAGDQLLCVATNQLQNCLRDRDTLARLGGDEFGILLENCPLEPALQIAEKLRQTVRDINFMAAGRSFRIGASIGLVSIGAEQFTPEEALRSADMACYLAKEKGRNRVQLFDAEDAEFARRFGDMIWAQRIHKALIENRFCLYRQDVMPLVSGDNNWHFELLLRLRDEAGLPIPPAEFLPTAERFGLMPQIDRWVVQKALQTLGERQARADARPVGTCSINLSGATLNDPGFPEYLRAQFQTYGVAPGVICFELNESAALQNMEITVRFVDALHEVGCRFALDNFGAGVASFSHLKQLPVDYVKIDGDFVRDMASDPVDDVMVDMIHKLARLTGKQTIAEFIERSEALDTLRSIGVDYAQGFAIARPEPFTEDG